MFSNALEIESKLIEMELSNNKISNGTNALKEAGKVSKENKNSNIALDEKNEEKKQNLALIKD